MFFFASPTFGRRDHSSSHNGRRRVAGGLRAPVQRNALKARVRSIVASGSAKLVAKNYAFGLRKVCEEVRRKKGAATRG